MSINAKKDLQDKMFEFSRHHGCRAQLELQQNKPTIHPKYNGYGHLKLSYIRSKSKNEFPAPKYPILPIKQSSIAQKLELPENEPIIHPEYNGYG